MPAYVIVDTDVRPGAVRALQGRGSGCESLPVAAASSPEAASSLLEGDWRPKRIVVLEFEDLEAVKRWYDSPEYREARRLREGAATLQAVAVEGL